MEKGDINLGKSEFVALEVLIDLLHGRIKTGKGLEPNWKAFGYTIDSIVPRTDTVQTIGSEMWDVVFKCGNDEVAKVTFGRIKPFFDEKKPFKVWRISYRRVVPLPLVEGETAIYRFGGDWIKIELDV